jgi:hypothetical protein
VLKTAKDDKVVFPHVDVCLAIAWVLRNNGRIIAGHVPGKWDEHSPLDPKGCADRIVKEMSRIRSEGVEDLVITLGDPGSAGWTRYVDAMVDGMAGSLTAMNLPPMRYLKIWKDVPGGVDLTVDGLLGTLECKSSRTDELIWQRNLNVIGQDRQSIRYDTPELFKMASTLKSHFKAEPFKGLNIFHASCGTSDRERITGLFKNLFQDHGACTAVQSPLTRELRGDITFTLGNGRKVIMRVVLAKNALVADRTEIQSLVLAPAAG